MKVYLRLCKELILPLGKDSNHSLALPHNENEQFKLDICIINIFKLLRITYLKKTCRCIDASSIELPPNRSLQTKLNSSRLTSKVSMVYLG
jgi:hypothetical protein